MTDLRDEPDAPAAAREEAGVIVMRIRSTSRFRSGALRLRLLPSIRLQVVNLRIKNPPNFPAGDAQVVKIDGCHDDAGESDARVAGRDPKSMSFVLPRERTTRLLVLVGPARRAPTSRRRRPSKTPLRSPWTGFTRSTLATLRSWGHLRASHGSSCAAIRETPRSGGRRFRSTRLRLARFERASVPTDTDGALTEVAEGRARAHCRQ